MGSVIPAEVWASLDAARSGRGRVQTRIAPAAPVDIFIAVEKPLGVRLLLVGLPTEDAAGNLDIPEARGIEVKTAPVASGPGWGFAEIRLTDLRYVEVFTTLADDLIGYIVKAENSAIAIDRLSDRLRRWESFLRVVEPDGLGPERQAGLYGELHTLREALFPIDPGLAINAWVGPENAQQDFQGRGWALEVKTSRTKEPISVRISGERQLDGVGLEFLGLVHLGLEERRHSGESLPEMVASIRSRLEPGILPETFDAKLLSAGYVAAHEARYLDHGYTVRFLDLFKVIEGFPRILERDLADGVGDVRYSVAVSALGTYKVPWGQLEKSIASGRGDE